MIVLFVWWLCCLLCWRFAALLLRLLRLWGLVVWRLFLQDLLIVGMASFVLVLGFGCCGGLCGLYVVGLFVV